MFFVRNGLPFDAASPLAEAERRAWVVGLGKLDGRTWNWGAMQ